MTGSRTTDQGFGLILSVDDSECKTKGNSTPHHTTIVAVIHFALGLSKAAIGGIAIGAVLAIAIVVAIVLMLVFRVRGCAPLFRADTRVDERIN